MILRAGAVLIFAFAAAAQNPAAPDGSLPQVLWRQPGPITIQDWICGPGGAATVRLYPRFVFLKRI